MKSKKGLSTIVTTLIIILLVLVAIGIVWMVVRGTIESGAGQVDVRAKCLQLDLEITSQTGTGCTLTGTGNCVVNVKRNVGGEDFTGVKIVASSSSASGVASDVAGTVDIMTTKPIAGNGFTGATKVTVTPYYTVEGTKQYCTNSAEFALV